MEKDEQTVGIDVGRPSPEGIISVEHSGGSHFLTEYDTLTGVRRELYARDDGSVLCKNYYDDMTVDQYANYCRKYGGAPDTEILKAYAVLSPYVQACMHKAGVDMRDMEEVFKYVNKHHPEKKVTNKWHDDKRARLKDPKVIVK